MIDVITYKKEVRHIDMNRINLSRGDYLIDLHEPELKELQKVSDLTKIYMSDLKNCLDPEEIPRIEQREKYLLIIFRAIYNENNRTTPFGVVIGRNFIIVVHSKLITPIKSLVGEVDIKLFKSGKENVIYSIFSDVIKEFSNNLEKLEGEVDNLDKGILNPENQSIINKMFSIKRSLIYSRKALLKNRDVLGLLQNTESKFIRKKELFNPLVVESMQLIDLEELVKDRLATLLEVHLSNASNRLNEIMKSFTVIASILLLPLLISGIYGMNFTILPLAEHKYGFYIILGVMLFSMIFTYVYFKTKRWL